MEKIFLPLAALLTWCPSAGYHSQLSLKCIKKQECVGKDLLTPYCSPQTLQEEEK